MVRTSQVKYLAPAIHAFLFLGMWVILAGPSPSFANGPSGLLLAILIVVDLPFSIVAWGVMFQGGSDGTIAVIAWGIGGTLWWNLLGLGIDALVSRSRRKPREVLLAVLAGLAAAFLVGGVGFVATLAACHTWVAREKGAAALFLASLTFLVLAALALALTFRLVMGYGTRPSN
jgi:hypothetical protein